MSRNRVVDAVDRTTWAIRRGMLDRALSSEALTRAKTALDLTETEHGRVRLMAGLARCSGRISQLEYQTLDGMLGRDKYAFNASPLAIKAALPLVSALILDPLVSSPILDDPMPEAMQ